MEQPKLNQDFIIQSLTNQVANLSLVVAERDSAITTNYQHIKELEKELNEYRDKEIKEMDKQPESNAK